MSRFLARSSTLILLLLFTLNAQGGNYNAVISIGDSMPSFSDLPDVSGASLSASDLKEDVVVLVSLANSCPFSAGAEPDLISLSQHFQDESVRIVAVGVNPSRVDDLPAMKEQAKKAGFNFNYVRDEDQTLGRQLGATVTPEFFVFNKERKLVYTGLLHNSPAMAYGEGKPSYLRGEPSEFYVRDAIANTLAGKAIAVTETAPYGCTIEYSTAER